MNLIKARGRLIYDPNRPGFNKVHKMRTLILQLPHDDLDLLYQWFIMRHTRSQVWRTIYDHNISPIEHETWQRPYIRRGDVVQMQRPMFGKHVTVVGGNEKLKEDLFQKHWKKYSSEVVEIEYAPVPRQHYAFWSLPVYCKRLQEIRQELGLSLEKDLHITIGRLYPWQPIHPSVQRTAWKARQELIRNGVLEK